MDNKRKGSASPQSPSGSDRFAWDEAPTRDTFTFDDDDDDGPLPAPPEFDGQGGGVPELLDADDIVDAPEPIEDPELLDSALVTELRPTHAVPPPIPAPVPTGPSQRAFIDDGEIALPPRISRFAQSFPFRKVRAEDEPSAEDSLTGFRSAALSDDDDDAAEELDADELESAEMVDDDELAAPPAVPPALRDDDDAPPPVRAAPSYLDDELSPPHAATSVRAPVTGDAPTSTGSRWSFADLDRRGADPEASRSAAQMFADDVERSADTVADGEIAGVGGDETGLFSDIRENSPTGLFARETLQPVGGRPPARAPSLPVDDDDAPLAGLPADDDSSEPTAFAASASPTPPIAGVLDDDDESTGVLAPEQLRNAAASSARLPVLDDDDRTSGWVQARPPQPSAAIPVAALDDDDDDATWAAAVRPTAPPASPTPPPRTIPPSAPPLVVPPVVAPVVTSVIDDDDSERSGIGGWIATRPGASMASGAIAVAEFGDDDDVWPQPLTPAPAQLSRPASAPVAAPERPEAPEQPEDPSAADEDDEWEPQTAAVGLAPIPEELGEPFPLDLWSDPDELLGRELGGVRLERTLSRGMTTRVYLGEQIETGRRVAVRVLGPMHSPAEPRARQFLYEAEQLIKLRSEHIVDVLSAGITNDHLTYYVMEYLQGETLASALRNEGPMPWAEVAAFANQICDALIIAGERGILHHDLRTSNCIRLPRDPNRAEGGRDVIKLLGVGVTPLTSEYRSADGTWTLSQGTPPGAAEFMAPEIAGGGRPDARTAVYAVGVLMYELTTGRPPFRGDSFISVLKKQMYEEPTSPRMVVPEQEVPEVFDSVVLKALSKAPGDRHSDLRALDEALLAARAREGELRRVTQILALDPAFWDEDGSRRIPPAGAAQSDPTPLATFASDLRQQQPELAAKVFPRSERSSVRSEPSVALHLTQLAAPIVAPAMPSAQQPAAQMPVIVLSRPPAAPSNTLFRNLSMAIVIASVVVVAALWLSDRGSQKRKAGGEVAVETKRPSKPKPRPTRDKPRSERPAETQPATVLAPPPEPEVKMAPPPEPEPEPIAPTPAPEAIVPTPEPEPEPVAKAPPPEPEPVAKAPPPEVKKPPVEKPPVEPEEDKAVVAKKTPRDPLDDRPEGITSGRLQAKLSSMEERVLARCRSKSGVPDSRGLKVSVQVTVNTRGEVKAKATAPWANTPMGQCIEEMLEAIRFNETRTGGGRTHTFTF